LSPDSQIGRFPPTRYSVVLAAQSDDRVTRSAAIDAISAAYWNPIYKYVRMKWKCAPEDAADFTQEFFTRLLEKDFLDDYSRNKGLLRTFLRTCADHLFMNQQRDAHRLKRGAGIPHLALNFEAAEQELANVTQSASPLDHFEKEWVRSLFTLGLQRLRADCESASKMVQFKLFEASDLTEDEPRPSYAQLSAQFGISVTNVTNYLAFSRREFRRCVLEQLRELTATDEEFRREARALLGVKLT
jgi:RNA polymerase sigma factor (sigma-70 family)